MTRYFRLMRVEAGHLCRDHEAGEDLKRVVQKKAKYGRHALRHFYAPLWIEANYSAKRVRTYMGYASIVQTYGYLFDTRDDDKEALKGMETAS